MVLLNAPPSGLLLGLAQTGITATCHLTLAGHAQHVCVCIFLFFCFFVLFPFLLIVSCLNK